MKTFLLIWLGATALVIILIGFIKVMLITADKFGPFAMIPFGTLAIAMLAYGFHNMVKSTTKKSG